MNLGVLNGERAGSLKTVEFLLLLFLFNDASCLKNIFSPHFTRTSTGEITAFFSVHFSFIFQWKTGSSASGAGGKLSDVRASIETSRFTWRKTWFFAALSIKNSVVFRRTFYFVFMSNSQRKKSGFEMFSSEAGVQVCHFKMSAKWWDHRNDRNKAGEKIHLITSRISLNFMLHSGSE